MTKLCVVNWGKNQGNIAINVKKGSISKSIYESTIMKNRAKKERIE